MLFYSAWKLTQGRGQSWSLSMVVSSFPARSRWVTSTILHLGKVVRTSTFCDLVSQGLRAQKITETPKSLVDTLPIKDIKDQNSAFCEVMISGLPNPLLNSSKPFQTLTVKPSKSSVQRFAGVRCRVRWGHIQHMWWWHMVATKHITIIPYASITTSSGRTHQRPNRNVPKHSADDLPRLKWTSWHVNFTQLGNLTLLTVATVAQDWLSCWCGGVLLFEQVWH